MDPTQVAVADVDEVGPDTVAITFETPSAFAADPGEFVKLRGTVDGEDVGRYYTLSSPTTEETFEVTVAIDPDGDLTPWLAALEPGDEVTVEGPFGQFAYTGDEDVLVLAGGPGVGAAVAIGERALDHGRSAAIAYLDDAPVHEDRLSALAAAGADVVLATDEDAFRASVGPLADAGQPYVFGFQEFCDRSLAALEDAGVDPDDVLVESFG